MKPPTPHLLPLRRPHPLALAVALACAAWQAPGQAQSPSTARPPVVFGSQLQPPAAGARQPLPQPYGSSRRADGSLLNDPALRSFVAKPAQAGTVRWTVNGNSATLDQGSAERVVLNWDSFDIGAGHSVRFMQDKDPAKAVSALNRIWSADPSLILGSLSADREVILVNANGLYFGRGARVDTGKFVATALGIADSVFERGLRNTTDASAVFSSEGTDHLPTRLADTATALSAAVSVQAGAEIRSAAGGDVLLVAPRVLNQGRISTPQGQAVLAAGDRVYLMSSSDPAQRGLIVAVDPVRLAGSTAVDAGLGVVENRAASQSATQGLAQQLDGIHAERGTVNLVGLTVRQNGQANATTAVKGANGAIHLQAMAATQTLVGGAGNASTATQFGLGVEAGATLRYSAGGGTVELGTLSSTTVRPEAGSATQLDAEVFNRSRIRIDGGAIAVHGGARIEAPAGQVDLLAAQATLTSPLFSAGVNTAPAQADGSRISVAPGAVLSVAGLQGVAVDGNRQQAAQRLFRIELADVPLQRSSPLYRSEVFFDLRQAAQVAVANVTGAAAAVARSADELSTAGGRLRIEAEGAVVVGAGAVLDVSGGSVQVSEARLAESVLQQGGRAVRFSAAAADTAVTGLGGAPAVTVVPAYTEGRSGGALTIGGRQLALAGALRGQVVQGGRQQAGTDPAAAPASVAVGRVFGASNTHYLAALQLQPGPDPALAAALGPAFWADPLAAPLAGLPSTSVLALQGLGAEHGFGQLLLSAASIAQSSFGTLDLGPGGMLQLQAQRIALDGVFHAPGGRLTLTTDAAEPGSGVGDIRLSSRTVLDAAGRWTNQGRRSADADAGATAAAASSSGGQVVLRAAKSLLADAGARIDVSGGAALSAAGKLSTGAAGAISLEIGRSALFSSSLQIDGVQLQGFDFQRGGRLNLGTPGLTLGGAGGAGGAGASASPGFQLDTTLFSEFGFGSISIGAFGDLRLASGFQLQPTLRQWQLAAGHAQVPSGAMGPAVANSRPQDPALADPVPVHLNLAATLPLNPALQQAGASLVVERGAGITLAPGGQLSLAASRHLVVGATGGLAGQASTLSAPGGALNLRISGQRGAGSLGEIGDDPAGFLADQALWLGADAQLSVAGTALLRPEPRSGLAGALQGSAGAAAAQRQTGTVWGGGSISLAAQRGYVVAQAGSVLRLDGAQAPLHLPGLADAVTVARPAGALSVASAEGITLEGTVSAAPPRDAQGRALADGGRLAVAIGQGGVNTFTQGPAYPGSLVDNNQGQPLPGAVAKPRSLLVTALGGVLGATPFGRNLPAVLDNGIARLSPGLLTGAGFDAMQLGAGDRIHFDTALDSFHPLGVVLDAPLLSARPGVAVALGGSQVALGDRTRDLNRRGAAPERSASADDPAVANTTLSVRATTIELVGQSALQGFNSVALQASGDIRLTAVNPAQGAASGSLAFASDLLLQAGQVFSTNGTAFTLAGLPAADVADRGSRLLLRQGTAGASALPPLSAFGSLSASATNIDHDGVLRQPFGAISLTAERQLALGPRSITSVSAEGAQLLVGSTDNLAAWTLPNGQQAQALPLAKRISLQAGQIDTAAGAKVDASGGGDVLAWEFFAGVGGSRDVLAADGVWAVLPDHADAPALALAGGLASANNAFGDASGLPGQQLVVTQAGGALPPGAYTLLPARQALLAGMLPAEAFLVKRAGSDAGGPLAPAQRLADGSSVITGQLRAIGSVHLSQPGERFNILPASSFLAGSDLLALARSDLRLTSISQLLARQASSAGRSEPPALPRDAGQVQVQVLAEGAALARALANTWQATLALGANGSGRAGVFDLSASRVALVDDASQTPVGAFGITAQALRDGQAGSVLLGGRRAATTAVGEGAASVSAFVVDSSGTQALSVQLAGAGLVLEELILASAGTLDIAAGSRLAASAGGGSLGGRTLLADGDGALAVVSANALPVQRSGAALAGGSLRIGAGAQLAGAHVQLDATGALQLDRSMGLDAAALGLAARRFSVGDAASPDAQATVLAGDLLATVRQADALTLRSYTGIDFAGSQAWAGRSTPGGAATQVQRSLVLDSPALRGVAAADASPVLTDIAAHSVVLRNTSGRSAGPADPGTGPADPGIGQLRLQALPLLTGGSSTSLVLGPGAVQLGFADVMLQSTGDAVFSGSGRSSARQDLQLQAARITASTGADQALVADAGRLVIGGMPGGRSSGQRLGQGASLLLSGATLQQAGHVDLPGGQLTLLASGQAAAPGGGAALEFAPGSTTSVAGFVVATTAAATVVGQPGSLQASAASGRIDLLGTLDASAAAVAGGGDGGQIGLRAVGPGGALRLRQDLASGSDPAGVLRAQGGSAGGERGGRLQIDVATMPSADDAARASTAGGISQGFDLRVRNGDVVLRSGLTAAQVSLAADAGNLALAGARLDARAPSGGVVALAAGADLLVDANSHVDARALRAGANGGDVLLASGQGRLRLAPGARVDAGGDDAGGGRIVLRAGREAAAAAGGASVRIDPLDTSRLQADEVVVEAVQVYRQVSANGASRDINNIAAGNSSIAGGSVSLGQASVASDNAALMAQAGTVLAGLGVAAADGHRVRLAPGVEVQASGALTVATDWALNDARSGAAAGVLTLRAAGPLLVNGSISDGFAGTASTAAILDKPHAWSLRLAAGADLSSALPLTLQDAASLPAMAAAGDLTVAAGRLLRTGAGSLQLAAARDLGFGAGTTSTAPGLVYVAGRPAADADGLQAALFAVQSARPQFTERGGSLGLRAGRDIVAAESPQLINNWLWRSGLLSNRDGEEGLYAANAHLAWWPQFNRLRQTAASFGGGDLQASAGRDIVNLQAMLPTQGWADSRVAADASLRIGGGGNMDVLAGRDVLGGQFLVGAGSGRLAAGSAVAAAEQNSRLKAPLLAQMDGASWSVLARTGLSVTGSVNPTAAPAPLDDVRVPLSGLFYTWGAGGGAALQLRSLAGDVALTGGVSGAQLAGYRLSSAASAENLFRVLPPSLQVAAISGGVRLLGADSVGALLAPSSNGRLAIWAAQDIRLGDGSSSPSLAMADSDAALWPTASRPTTNANALFNGAGSAILASLSDALPRQGSHAGDAEPVAINAGGSLILPETGAGALRLAKPALISAGQDILNLRLVGQNLALGDTTRISAGRNYLAGNLGLVELIGPGALELSAGVDLDLGASAGVRSSGNLRNARLPAQGASVRLAAATAGVLDVAAFEARYLLPGGLVPDMRAQTHRAALLAQVRQSVADPTLSDAAAWLQFQAMPAATQAALAGTVLAAEFGQRWLTGPAPTLDDVAVALRAGFELRRAGLLAAGEAALAAGQPLRLPGGLLLGERPAGPATTATERDAQRAALRSYLDGMAALAFDQIDTRAVLQARQASLVAVRQGWRDAVAGQLGGTAAGFEALPPADPAAQAYQALLGARSGPLFQRYSQQVLAVETTSAATAAAQFGLQALPLRLALFDQGFDVAELVGAGSFVPQAVWPGSSPVLRHSGNLQLTQSAVVTERGGDISLVNPGGAINVGLKQTIDDGRPKGVIALGGGDVFGFARDDFQVNTQRVFIVGAGNMNLWSSVGDIDSGRGANTAVAAPPLAARRSADGVVFEVPATTTGSGLAILADANGRRSGSIGLFPAFGEILALDAFIRAPSVVVGATVRGADSIQGNTSGANAPTVAAPATVAPPPTSESKGAAQAAAADQQAAARPRNALLTVELLGTGEAPDDDKCADRDRRDGKCPQAPR